MCDDWFPLWWLLTTWMGWKRPDVPAGATSSDNPGIAVCLRVKEDSALVSLADFRARNYAVFVLGLP
jgi:hypothetical protein